MDTFVSQPQKLIDSRLSPAFRHFELPCLHIIILLSGFLLPGGA